VYAYPPSVKYCATSDRAGGKYEVGPSRVLIVRGGKELVGASKEGHGKAHRLHAMIWKDRYCVYVER